MFKDYLMVCSGIVWVSGHKKNFTPKRKIAIDHALHTVILNSCYLSLHPFLSRSLFLYFSLFWLFSFHLNIDVKKLRVVGGIWEMTVVHRAGIQTYVLWAACLMVCSYQNSPYTAVQIHNGSYGNSQEHKMILLVLFIVFSSTLSQVLVIMRQRCMTLKALNVSFFHVADRCSV